MGGRKRVWLALLPRLLKCVASNCGLCSDRGRAGAWMRPQSDGWVVDLGKRMKGGVVERNDLEQDWKEEFGKDWDHTGWAQTLLNRELRLG